MRRREGETLGKVSQGSVLASAENFSFSSTVFQIYSPSLPDSSIYSSLTLVALQLFNGMFLPLFALTVESASLL
jgi:hypothetical protein